MKRVATMGLVLLGMWCGAAGAVDAVRHIQSGGRDRAYLLHVPADQPTTAMALVVVLHGGGGSGESAAKMTHFSQEADQEGFLVVYPDGTDKKRPLLNAMGKPGFLTWDAGGCCGYARDNGVDDVAFIRAVVADVENVQKVDAKRIYATGISNGGMMAYRLACEASDVFAAIGPVSAIQDVKTCKPAERVSVIHFHGTDDENVPLAGGVGKKALDQEGKQGRPPVQDSIDFWVKQDQCDVTVASKQPDLDVTNYGGCLDGTDVIFYKVLGGGHAWPGGDQILKMLDKPDPNVNATDTIWRFFKDHPKH